MTQKARIEANINDMVIFGETFIGTIETQGDAVVRYYKALSKQVAKQYNGQYIVAWDGETGMAWMV